MSFGAYWMSGDLDDLVADNERDGIADALAERSEADRLYARWQHLHQVADHWRRMACEHLTAPESALLDDTWRLKRARRYARCAARVSVWASECAGRMTVYARR